MRGMISLLSSVVALAGLVVYMARATGDAAGEVAPLFGIKIPPGYRDWKLISVAHEEGVTSRPRKTTKSLAVPSPSLPVLPQMFSLWSRIQKNTGRRAVGGSLNLKTAILPTRRCSKPA